MIFKHSKTVFPQVVDTYYIHTLSLHISSWEKNIAVDWKFLKTHLKSLIHRDGVGHGFPWWLSDKESAYQCRRYGLDPWVRKIPWRSGMAPHSSVLAWRTPWTEEPGGPQCVGRRVGHD